MNTHEHTIGTLKRALEAGETTATQVLDDTIARLHTKSYLNAFITLPDEDALRTQAHEIDALRTQGLKQGTLAGVPIAIKDNICVRGQRVSAGSRILDDFVSPYDATVITKLRNAGALLIGKTNLDEFAMGSSNEHSAFGPVLNPAKETHVPGGSSGGSAAAVRAGLCTAALGSDTGGSIRQPASHCGVVGLKPTYGRISRYGLIAFASSLDQIGPMTRSVEDAALLLEVLAGQDPMDMTSAPQPVGSYVDACTRGVHGLKIGVPREYFGKAKGLGQDADVQRLMQERLHGLKAQGAQIVDISLPHTEYAVATYYLIATAEASSNLARFDGVRYGHRAQDPSDLQDLYERSRAQGFGDEVKRRIMLGTFVLSAGFYDAYYLKAQKVRTLIARDFLEAFTMVDAIVAPTAPAPAFAFGTKSQDPLRMYLEDIYTIPCNLAGIPGISVPAGVTSNDLPVGIQVFSKAFDEETLFQVAASIEQDMEQKRGHAS